MNYSNIPSNKRSRTQNNVARHAFVPYSDSPYICRNGVRVDKTTWYQESPVTSDQRSIVYPSTETDELLPMFDLPNRNYMSAHDNNRNYSANNLCK
uniref:Uncharacterized protein n=1 Tax=viral metagenome TaxID=1070528 RepID=A0A6C0C9J7_9ZZZZ